jgi:hypothetical protein
MEIWGCVAALTDVSAALLMRESVDRFQQVLI